MSGESMISIIISKLVGYELYMAQGAGRKEKERETHCDRSALLRDDAVVPADQIPCAIHVGDGSLGQAAIAPVRHIVPRQLADRLQGRRRHQQFLLSDWLLVEESELDLIRFVHAMDRI